MNNEYVLTNVEDEGLAIRTVVAEESSSATGLDVLTTTSDGKLAIRTVVAEGGGGDQHNLGYYATPTALEEAYPTATAGDWAIVGSTDSVWLWDTDNEEWVDSDQKGQVTSVNGQTGAVTISADDIITAGTGIDITNGTVSVEHPIVVQGDTILVEGEKASGSTGYNSVAVGVRSKTRDNCVVIGCQAGSAGVGTNSVLIGEQTSALANKDGGIAIGASATAYGNYGVAIGSGASSGADNAIQIGRGVYPVTTNSDANTFKVANANGNFEIMSANGTVPTDRFTTTPTVAGTYSATIVVDGQGNITRSWATAPDTLPSQTGQSGKFLTTDGTDASWSDKPLVNKATGTNSLSIDSAIAATASNCVNIGSFSRGGTNCTKIGYAAGGSDDIPEDSVFIGAFTEDINNGSQANAIGCYAHAGAGALAIGYRAQANNGNIQLVMNYFGRTPQANGDVNTFKVANANGNFKIMSADGTIPTARLTKVNSTITLAAADWSSNTQTVNVTGMTADGVVFPCPIPADQADYTAAGIICSAQASGTLTFTCDTVPSGDIDVTVVMM